MSATIAASPEVRSDQLVERLFDLLISRDLIGARGVLARAMDGGVDAAGLIEHACGPLQRMIDDLHARGQLSSLARFYATQLLQTLIDDLGHPLAADRWSELQVQAPIALRCHAQFVSMSFRAGTLTATLIGPMIGHRQASIISQELSDAAVSLGAGLRILLLDFSEIRAVGSVAIGMCVQLHGIVRRHGGQIVFKGLSDDLRNLFDTVRATRLIPVIETREDLLRHLAA